MLVEPRRFSMRLLRHVALAALGLVMTVLGFSLPRWRGEQIPVLELRAESFVHQVSAEGVLRAARSIPITAPAASRGPAKIAWLIEDGALVRRGDVVARFDPTEMEQALFEGEVALAVAERKLQQSRTKSEAALLNVERDGALAREELRMAQEFQDKDPEIFSRVAIVESAIDARLAERKVQHAREQRGTHLRLAGSEQKLLSIEKGQATGKIDRARRGLSLLEVRAPHDGIVILIRDWRGETRRVGDVVFAAQPIAELPGLEEMEAEVHVLEADAGGLVEGAAAEVVVEGHPEERFPAAIKSVERVPKPRVRGVPVHYFAVTLSLAHTDPESMKPGQRVRATLHLAERSQALVVPRQAVFERGAKNVVFRRSGNRFEEVEVELGNATLGRVIVESGLREGDAIALRDPGTSYREAVPADKVEAEP